MIGPMAGEQSGLSLIHAVLWDVSKRWRGIKMAPADLETLNLTVVNPVLVTVAVPIQACADRQ